MFLIRFYLRLCNAVIYWRVLGNAWRVAWWKSGSKTGRRA